MSQYIGHNGDAPRATVNRFYVVSAHVVPTFEELGGVFGAREEKWEAMTHAGLLSGHACGHNFHGLVFTVNALFAKRTVTDKIRE